MKLFLLLKSIACIILVMLAFYSCKKTDTAPTDNNSNDTVPPVDSPYVTTPEYYFGTLIKLQVSSSDTLTSTDTATITLTHLNEYLATHKDSITVTYPSTYGSNTFYYTYLFKFSSTNSDSTTYIWYGGPNTGSVYLLHNPERMRMNMWF